MNGQEYMNELYDIEYPLTSLGVFWLNLTYLRNETDDYFHFISKKFRQWDFRTFGMEKYTIQQKRTIINILNILK